MKRKKRFSPSFGRLFRPKRRRASPRYFRETVKRNHRRSSIRSRPSIIWQGPIGELLKKR